MKSRSPARPRKRRWIPRIAVLAVVSLGLWAFVIEPSRLVVHHETLRLPSWPRESAPLRIAVLSDLHVGSPYWGIESLPKVVERTNAEAPDLVLLAGDYMTEGEGQASPESIARVLHDFKAPLGVVAVLGNHDWWNNGYRVRGALRAQGITTLENESLVVTTSKGRHVVIVGLADATRAQNIGEAFSRVPRDEKAVIALVHEPDLFRSVGDRARLTVAGHTHGGQVRLPWIGSPIVPSDYGQRYARGHVEEDGHHLFVTTGIGTSRIPVRFGVPPEIAILTLE